jgi:hypothetical protein
MQTEMVMVGHIIGTNLLSRFASSMAATSWGLLVDVDCVGRFMHSEK